MDFIKALTWLKFLLDYRFNFTVFIINHKLLIQGFTGITQEYERPEAPELVIQTVGRSVEESTMEVVRLLESQVSLPS